MKLVKSLVLLTQIYAARWEKCSKIEAVDGQTNLKCAGKVCRRKCEPGYKAVGTKKATCLKNEDGTFEWDKTLGGCKTCQEPNDLLYAVECKINSRKQRICRLNCTQHGTFLNGKPDKTEMKMTCRCNKKGCNWRNKYNKKISAATINGGCKWPSDLQDDLGTSMINDYGCHCAFSNTFAEILADPIDEPDSACRTHRQCMFEIIQGQENCNANVTYDIADQDILPGSVTAEEACAINEGTCEKKVCECERAFLDTIFLFFVEGGMLNQENMISNGFDVNTECGV